MSAINTPATTISVRNLIAQNKLVISYHHAIKVQAQNPGRISWEDPATLLIDGAYQRSLNTRHALGIAQKFDHLNMKPATGFRDTATGEILITDGQHTVTAAAICGLAKVPVYVHDLPAGISAQAALAMQSKQFLSINLSNKPVSRYDIYRNKLIQQDKDFLAMDAMCKRAGVTPCASKRPDNTQPGALSHIANLELAWFNIGHQAAEDALVFMRSYFPNEPIHGAMFAGVARFVKNMKVYQDYGCKDAEWDGTTLANALSKNGTRDFNEIYEDMHELNKKIGHYGASATTQQWVAGMMVQTYNAYVAANTLSVTPLGKYC